MTIDFSKLNPVIQKRRRSPSKRLMIQALIRTLASVALASKPVKIAQKKIVAPSIRLPELPVSVLASKPLQMPNMQVSKEAHALLQASTPDPVLSNYIESQNRIPSETDIYDGIYASSIYGVYDCPPRFSGWRRF